MAARPFVKWVGGKGQLIGQLSPLLPKDLSERAAFVYVEPFVGGGAMLFYVLSRYPNIERAVANDLNVDLVTTYKVVQNKLRTCRSCVLQRFLSMLYLPFRAVGRPKSLDA